jgi:hypothetical protein
VFLTTDGPAEQVATLDPESLAAYACRQSGDQTEPLRYLDGLAKLCTALDTEAGLTTAGRIRVRAALISALVTQCRVRAAVAADPTTARTPIRRPVFITGLLRTGTTFLQQLLARHPDLRAPRLWELMAPAGPGEPADLIAACESYVAEYYQAAPGFRAIHPLGAELPEECHRLMANTFRDSIYGLRYRVPGYVEWLRGKDMVPAYEFHRTALQCILARRGGSGAVLLKGPSHLWHLDALARVYPDARIIRLHRSPAVSVPSVCSLTSVVRGARAATVDNAEIGRYWLDQVGPLLDRLRPGVAPTATPPLDVRYQDLVADPMSTVDRVCDYIGVPLTGAAGARMADLVAPAAGNHTGHRYSAADFGLSTNGLNQRFAAYLDAFELHP